MPEQENERIVRAVMDAWNRGDRAALLSQVDDEVVLESAFGLVEGRFEGQKRGMELIDEFWDSFSDFHTEIRECIAEGDQVVIEARHNARGKSSRIEVEMENWQVITLRDGKVTRWGIYETRDDALEASGVSGQPG